MSYSEHINAFIDILGFKELVKSATTVKKAETIINNIDKAINNGIHNNVKEYVDDENKDRIQYKIFSDNVSISMEINDETPKADQIFYFLSIIVYVQAELLEFGFFIRGGISIDYHYENQNMIFSKALIKSYEIESKLAVYPRIVIDNDLVKFIKKYYDDSDYESWNGLITRDADSCFFLNYLSYIEEIEFEIDIFKYLSAHKNAILKELFNASDPYILTKYLWVSKYHNYIVSSANVIQKNDLIINAKLLDFNKNIFETYAIIIISINKKNKDKYDLSVFICNHTYSALSVFKSSFPKLYIKTVQRLYSKKEVTIFINNFKKEGFAGNVIKYVYRKNRFFKK